MKTIVVDDEKMALELFCHQVQVMPDVEIVGKFSSGADALRYAEKQPVDLAVLDVEMPDMNGITLGARLKMMHPDILLIYITGHEGYAMDALKLRTAAYLLKPYTNEEISYAIESVKLLAGRRKKKIFVRTFGHFDVFVDGKPILFHSGKAKELLAYLIDREGGSVTSDQIISVLWEDRPNDESTQSLCSKVVKTLKKELMDNNAEELLVTGRGFRYVNTDVFECDLYDLLKHGKKSTYYGEYMTDYSWGEHRNAILYQEIEKNVT